MNRSRYFGDAHVQDVYDSLQHRLTNGSWPSQKSRSAIISAQYIWDLYPQPEEISYKFSNSNPDKHKDITIKKDGQVYPINLYIIKGNNPIQPKNLGAKSFLSKYFLSDDLQAEFNETLTQEYILYLQSLIELTEGFHYGNNISILRAKVRDLFPSFVGDSNQVRDSFLYSIRDLCFTLLQRTYNTNQHGFNHAFQTLLLMGETNIITRIIGDDTEVEQFNPQPLNYNNITVYKKGRHSIGIQGGPISLVLRFKFENKPDSSIKLATSYEFFEDDKEFNALVVNQNRKTIQRMEQLFSSIQYAPSANTSNAVGKCHEALAYFWLLNRFPKIIQTDDKECITFITKYAPIIDEITAQKIKIASAQTADVIINYIETKYTNVTIESIQLVADIYTTDRLNTGDLMLSIRREDGQVEETYISLKAVRTFGQKITTKNPGIGTILGPTYFNIKDDFSSAIAEVREMYDHGLSHQDCLANMSGKIGIELEKALQENLRRGIENLLGKALMVITAYEINQVHYLEHTEISTHVQVLRDNPSPSQNTLVWNDGDEQISLRVKFSKGHHHGWSSIKLTSEYLYDPVSNQQ